MRFFLLSPRARLLRFLLIGSISGCSQLALLLGLLTLSWPTLAANTLAFILAAQCNFLMNSFFTWHDRKSVQSLSKRWLTFHGSISGMALLNLCVFAATHTIIPALLASVLGIGAGAVGNFFINDRLVFRAQASA